MKYKVKAFSRRQTEVLHLLAEQYTYDQMSSILNLSKNTIHTHVSKIMDKTGIRKQILLIKYAQRHGYGKKKRQASA